MLAGLRLIRRLGLAVGTWFLVCYLGYYISFLFTSGAAAKYASMMAVGAAILAFFLPQVEASSFTPSDKLSA